MKMLVDGEPVSARGLLRLIGQRKFGLLDCDGKNGSCRVRLWGECDRDALLVTGATVNQLSRLAEAAEWVGIREAAK